MEGVLVKQGKVVKNWKSRYFVLNMSENKLRYFKNKGDKTEKGFIDFSKTITVLTVEDCKTAWPSKANKKNCFGLRSEIQTMYIYAETADSFELWMQAFRNECNIIMAPEASSTPELDSTANLLNSTTVLPVHNVTQNTANFVIPTLNSNLKSPPPTKAAPPPTRLIDMQIESIGDVKAEELDRIATAVAAARMAEAEKFEKLSVLAAQKAEEEIVTAVAFVQKAESEKFERLAAIAAKKAEEEKAAVIAAIQKTESEKFERLAASLVVQQNIQADLSDVSNNIPLEIVTISLENNEPVIVTVDDNQTGYFVLRVLRMLHIIYVKIILFSFAYIYIICTQK